ncbi:methyltransferase domain-containing protein [Cytophagales bacterium LB-30]|uniref:Methyltransferase domain-containing protein n=1 Tax=Shiella aurantiaca TaxID=3058365 RepID=A0ABT8F920_9BACT|nr:methyltransferase domain-containing protein [Shiella aurantiaca]MDN4166978.1 methyltransferase domain-containing protein [Shiella aurantiaca]
MKKIISFLLRKVPRKYLQLFSHWVLKVVALFYRGNKVECPVCEHHFAKFLPYGRINPRANALCPNCLSLERHRLMWLFLKEKTDFFTANKRILHVAPELCFIDRFEKIHGQNYITADIESPLAKVKMDIHAIPFPDNSFDVAFCNHVMEHVQDDIKAMSELHRILKPGGWAIIQIPFFHPIPEVTFQDESITDPKEREKMYGQDDHVRLYGKDYANRLAQGGFTVDENTFINQLPANEVARYALPANEIIYLCRKN